MKKTIFSLAIAYLSTLIPFYSYAGPLEDGIAAYKAEKYQEAYSLVLPLANTYAKPETAKAQYLIGNLYFSGLGVEKSETTAWKWHKKAVQGFRLRKNYGAIKNMLQPYVNNNITSGKIEFAKLMMTAGNKDERKEGRNYIETLAAQGDAIAQYEMATIDDGSGLDRFQRMARKIKWYKLSADQGYAPAQIAYGNALGRGSIAVSQKIHAAKTIADMPTTDKAEHKKWKDAQKLKWLKKAAAQDNPDGLYKLGMFYKSQYSEESWQQAYAVFKEATELGHLKAQYQLASILTDGYGAAQNKEKAASLFQDLIDRIEVIPLAISDTHKRLRWDAESSLKKLQQGEKN